MSEVKLQTTLPIMREGVLQVFSVIAYLMLHLILLLIGP